MDRVLPTVIVVIVLLGVLLLMLRSWRRRTRRDAGLAAGYPAPAESAPLESAGVLYVATTPRDAPLERLAIPGLAFRARATLTVTDAGAIVAPNGENSVFIPVSAIERVTEATWAIDRAVETGGLLLIGWMLNTAPAASTSAASTSAAAASASFAPAATSASATTSVDSYFRITDPADRVRIVAALRSIAPEATGPDLSTESEA
ncbi:hypothetical protein GCM10022381_07850 [Leifsonia kafniensis]|uniref:PH domain-containing protein n=1 Tax=Leifsonia kafniensis TaxID=475957 RepID=A0ABP7K786_9MICO